MDFLRDPIWEGIAAIVTMAGAVFGIAFFIFPEFRGRIREWMKRFLESKTLHAVLVIVVCLFFGLAMIYFSLTENISLPSLRSTTRATATLPPPTPISLFFDDFNGNPNPEWVSAAGTWQMVNNRYTLTGVQSTWTTGISLVGDPSWTDYRVRSQVKIEVDQFSSENVAYIIVRAQDENNFLALAFRDGGFLETPSAVWFIVQSGEWQELSNTKWNNEQLLESFDVRIEV
jgi:hypothetical protein